MTDLPQLPTCVEYSQKEKRNIDTLLEREEAAAEEERTCIKGIIALLPGAPRRVSCASQAVARSSADQNRRSKNLSLSAGSGWAVVARAVGLTLRPPADDGREPGGQGGQGGHGGQEDPDLRRGIT